LHSSSNSVRAEKIKKDEAVYLDRKRALLTILTENLKKIRLSRRSKHNIKMLIRKNKIRICVTKNAVSRKDLILSDVRFCYKESSGPTEQKIY
jgi:hypothetical protein